MTIVHVQIPDSLHKSLYDLANRDGISTESIYIDCDREKPSALMTENYLKERVKRGSQLRYKAILAKVPDIEPEEYDKLPNV